MIHIFFWLCYYDLVFVCNLLITSFGICCLSSLTFYYNSMHFLLSRFGGRAMGQKKILGSLKTGWGV